MKSIHFTLLITLVLISAINSLKSYEGYKVYKVIPKSEDDLKILEDLRTNSMGEFWDDQFYVNYKSQIMVPSDKQHVFLNRMKVSDMNVTLIIDDLQR